MKPDVKAALGIAWHYHNTVNGTSVDADILPFLKTGETPNIGAIRILADEVKRLQHELAARDCHNAAFANNLTEHLQAGTCIAPMRQNETSSVQCKDGILMMVNCLFKQMYPPP